MEIKNNPQVKEQVKTFATELGVSDRIAFAGPKDIAYVRDKMDKSDLFMLASVTAANGDTEGAPVSLLEAQASGMPVISTRHAGIPEIVIDNESGYLAPEGNTLGLTDALRRLLGNAKAWPDMGRRGRAFVEQRHDIKILNRRLVDLYEEAAARFAPSSCSGDLGNISKEAAPILET